IRFDIPELHFFIGRHILLLFLHEHEEFFYCISDVQLLGHKENFGLLSLDTTVPNELHRCIYDDKHSEGMDGQKCYIYMAINRSHAQMKC
ncbi:unnamed protein product, partial [Urochloa humidicola]